MTTPDDVTRLSAFEAVNPEFEALHPRGRDGKWIEKFGIVKIFKSATDTTQPIVGKVERVIDANTIWVRRNDTDQVVSVTPKQLEQSEGKARLDNVKSGLDQPDKPGEFEPLTEDETDPNAPYNDDDGGDDNGAYLFELSSRVHDIASNWDDETDGDDHNTVQDIEDVAQLLLNGEVEQAETDLDAIINEFEDRSYDLQENNKADLAQLFQDYANKMRDVWQDVYDAKKAKTSEAELPAPETESESGLLDTTNWKKVGGQAGSNPGGFYEDESGKRWYVKESKSEEHAYNEVLATELYHAAGVKMPELRLAKVNGKTGVASAVIDKQPDGLKAHLNDKAYLREIQDGFAVDAWLANWDVAGLVYDNIETDADGSPIRIDTGGALTFRAQGAPKGQLFGDEVGELKTLRDAGMNPQSAKIFGSMTDEDVKKSAERVKNVTPEQIDQAFEKIGWSQPAADALKKKLIARRLDLLGKVGLDDNASASPNAEAPKPAKTKKSPQQQAYEFAPSFNEDVAEMESSYTANDLLPGGWLHDRVESAVEQAEADDDWVTIKIPSGSEVDIPIDVARGLASGEIKNFNQPHVKAEIPADAESPSFTDKNGEAVVVGDKVKYGNKTGLVTSIDGKLIGIKFDGQEKIGFYSPFQLGKSEKVSNATPESIAEANVPKPAVAEQLPLVDANGNELKLGQRVSEAHNPTITGFISTTVKPGGQFGGEPGQVYVLWDDDMGKGWRDPKNLLGHEKGKPLPSLNKPAKAVSLPYGDNPPHAEEGKAVLENSSQPVIQAAAVKTLERFKKTFPDLTEEQLLSQAYEEIYLVYGHEIEVTLNSGETIGVDKNVAPLVVELDNRGMLTASSSDGTRTGEAMVLFKEKGHADKLVNALTGYKVASVPGPGYESLPAPGHIVITRSGPGLAPDGEVVWMHPQDLADITEQFTNQSDDNQVGDANGTPIKIGDKIVDDSGEYHGKVIDIIDQGDDEFKIKVQWTNGNKATLDPDELVVETASSDSNENDGNSEETSTDQHVSADGKTSIKVGDKVKNKTKGYTGTVVKLESNGKYVKVQVDGNDPGKLNGLKTSTLTILNTEDSAAAPEATLPESEATPPAEIPVLNDPRNYEFVGLKKQKTFVAGSEWWSGAEYDIHYQPGHPAGEWALQDSDEVVYGDSLEDLNLNVLDYNMDNGTNYVIQVDVEKSLANDQKPTPDAASAESHGDMGEAYTFPGHIGNIKVGQWARGSVKDFGGQPEVVRGLIVGFKSQEGGYDPKILVKEDHGPVREVDYTSISVWDSPIGDVNGAPVLADQVGDFVKPGDKVSATKTTMQSSKTVEGIIVKTQNVGGGVHFDQVYIQDESGEVHRFNATEVTSVNGADEAPPAPNFDDDKDANAPANEPEPEPVPVLGEDKTGALILQGSQITFPKKGKGLLKGEVIGKSGKWIQVMEKDGTVHQYVHPDNVTVTSQPASAQQKTPGPVAPETAPETPKEPEVQEYVPKGDFVLGANGAQIFHGSIVKSKKDGLEGEVIYIEPNGTHVKVLGADGKVRGRRNNTLEVTGHKYAPAGSKVAAVDGAPFAGGKKANGFKPNTSKNGPVTVSQAPTHPDANKLTPPPTPKKVEQVDGPWTGQPKPQAPTNPTTDHTEKYLDPAWLAEVEARYEAFAPGKKLQNSNNWSRVQNVINSGDLSDLKHLLDKNYITQQQYDAAKAQIDTHNSAKAKKMAEYATAVEKWKQDYADWKIQNGVGEAAFNKDDFVLTGMDDALDWSGFQEAKKWANQIWPQSSFYKSHELTALKQYTADHSHEINSSLYNIGLPTLTSLDGINEVTKKKIHGLDDAMEHAPRVPETIYVTRTVGTDAFRDAFNSKLGWNADLTSIQGTVQHNFGYSSTSISGKHKSGTVSIKLKVPAGQKAVFVWGNGISGFGEGERELLLDRGMHFYVHSVTKNGSQWIVEAEIVPAGWIP